MKDEYSDEFICIRLDLQSFANVHTAPETQVVAPVQPYTLDYQNCGAIIY